MHSVEQFRALERRMMANVAGPSDLWQVEAYLTESRKTVD
jgi:hypothetical protein